MNGERGEDANRKRRAVLRGVAALTGAVVGCGSVVGASESALGAGGDTGSTGPENVVQQVDTSLPPGVTLFDLDGNGEFDVTVERAPAEMQDDAHPDPIHVTSNGRSTVDYAASVAEPPTATTLGNLGSLTYDYYEGANNVNPDVEGGGFAPDETFLVVENSDGRHGTYLTYNDAEEAGNAGITTDGTGGAGEEWQTFDVLARMQGDTSGTSGWFEYTSLEEGYSGRTFDSVVERFGSDARLVQVGVGHGNAVNPASLDLYYDRLTIDDETRQFPSEVVKRTA